MNRLDQLFKRKNKRILSIYFTAGFPSKENIEEQILLLEKAGADLIELGLPFSDPLADGPVIQRSSQIALEYGMNADYLFDALKNIRSKTEIPLIIMGYYNCFLQYGESRFLERCKKTGIDGLIIPDLPPEIFELKYQSLFADHNIHFSLLISPQCSDARIKYLDELSSGFVYAVTQSSTTGNKQNLQATSIQYFEKLKSLNLRNPVLAGFGIDSNEKFNLVCNYLNGGIIGSAYIEYCSVNGVNENLTKFIQELLKKENHAYSN